MVPVAARLETPTCSGTRECSGHLHRQTTWHALATQPAAGPHQGRCAAQQPPMRRAAVHGAPCTPPPAQRSLPRCTLTPLAGASRERRRPRCALSSVTKSFTSILLDQAKLASSSTSSAGAAAAGAPAAAPAALERELASVLMPVHRGGSCAGRGKFAATALFSARVLHALSARPAALAAACAAS